MQQNRHHTILTKASNKMNLIPHTKRLTANIIKKVPNMKVPNWFSGIRDFPCLKLGIRDFTARSGKDSGFKVFAEGGMPKITLGITGLLEILVRDYGIEKPY